MTTYTSGYPFHMCSPNAWFSELCFKREYIQKSIKKVFKNTDEGIEQFMTLMEDFNLSQGKTRIGVEATGAYHLLLAITLVEHDWDMYVINPLESHKFITSSLRTVKTDKIDAGKIREMVILGRGYLLTDTEETIALKALVTERSVLVETRTAMKQRKDVHEIKEDAIGFTLHDSFDPVIAALDTAIADCEKHMKEYEKETQKLLRSIPGVGKVSAAVLVSFIGNIHRFDSPEKLVAYIGLDPRVYQSGTSVQGKGYISKRGNKYLRKTLFNAAFVAMRWNPTLKEYYDKKMSEGKHHFSATCAIERKLVHIIYAVWKRDTPFEKR